MGTLLWMHTHLWRGNEVSIDLLFCRRIVPVVDATSDVNPCGLGFKCVAPPLLTYLNAMFRSCDSLGQMPK